MTSKQVVQQALEALESLQRYDGTLTGAQVATAIESLRGALAQQRELGEQKPVAYLAWRDGKPCYAGEDVVCADPVWPVDSDDDRTSMPVYTGAAPTAQRCDTARVLEWMRTPNRKAAQFAFTEGPERQAAYWIEIAQGEPAAQPDARKVIEQMVVALEIAERHLAYVEITEAREAGQQRLEENK